MARPNKTGLDYFNLDTDFHQDLKIKLLKRERGPAGVAVYTHLLCEIYRVKGCFLEWNVDRAFDVSDYWGLAESDLEKIIVCTCRVGLFDEKLFDERRILTSKSTQSRYIKICREARRKGILIPEEIRLIPEETEFLQEETPDFKTESTQRKVKEKKEKKSEKENPSTPDFDSVVMETIGECAGRLKSRGESFFFLARSALAGKRDIDSADELAGLIDRFAVELSARGDTLKNPRDFQSHFINWLKNPKNGTTSPKNENSIYIDR